MSDDYLLRTAETIAAIKEAVLLADLRDRFAIAVLPVFATYADDAEEAGRRAYAFADGAMKARGA